MGLVVVTVARMTYKRRPARFDPSHDDLVQFGVLGLMKAAGWHGRGKHGSEYDPEKGKFSTYACRWIRQAVQRALLTGGVGYGMERMEGERQILCGSEDSDMTDAPAHADGPDVALERKEQAERVKCALRGLSAREADIVRRYWGIGGGHEETLQDIAVTHGISRERVRQIKLEAMDKLRVHMQRARV